MYQTQNYQNMTVQPSSIAPSTAPPPYEPCITDPRTSLSSSRHSSLPTPPTSRSSSSQSPTYTPATKASLPLTIPTKKYQLSSGFPYQSTIFDLGISPDTWASFSDEIVRATKLSLTQQSLAWTSGIGVGLVSVAAVPPFGAAAGVFAGKAVYDKNILHKVKQGLEQGKLGEVLNHWNDNCWREKGVVVRLVMKQNKADSKKDKKKDQKREAGRFELILDSAAAANAPTIAVTDDRISSELDNNRPSPAAELGNRSIAELGNRSTFELGNRSIAELGNRSTAELATVTTSHSPPTSRLADEKAALAETARYSWDPNHNPEQQQAPRFVLVDGHGRTSNTDDPQSPVSDVSRFSYVQGSSQELEVSPVSAIEGRNLYDHGPMIMESSLAPAPLFAR